jgi:hypothetical protein
MSSLHPDTVTLAEDALSQKPEPGDETARSGHWLDITIVLVFLAAAVWILSPWWVSPSGREPSSNVTDPIFFEWALQHATKIFTHGDNPFFTAQLNAPYGVNLIANTGLLGLTVPLVPVTLLFGPSVSLVLMLTLALPATATTWYWVLSRHLLHNRLAAAIAGGFAGFAPGMVNHTNAHPNLTAQFLFPIILWRALKLRTLKQGVILGLLIVWQMLINEELVFLAGLAGFLFVAIYAIFRWSEVRAAIGPFLRGLVGTAVTVGVLMAYPLYFQFAGAQAYQGLPDFVLGYGTDLAAFSAFPKISVAHGAGTLAPLPEENTFFGWPLLIVALIALVCLWRNVVVRAVGVLGVIFAVLALGAPAAYKGKVFWHRAPWINFNHLPLFDSVVPTRLGLVLIPLLALLIGYAVVASLRRDWPLPWLRFAGIALALVPILPIQLPVRDRPAVPRFFTNGDWKHYVGSNESIVSADTTVWYGGVNAMAWDNAVGQQFAMEGGYFLGPDETGRGTYGTVQRPTALLLAGIANGDPIGGIGEAEQAQALADLRFWHAGIVVLTPDTLHDYHHADNLKTVLTMLLGTGQQVDDVTIWNART